MASGVNASGAVRFRSRYAEAGTRKACRVSALVCANRCAFAPRRLTCLEGRPSLAEFADKPGFDHLGQERIAEQHEGQVEPVECRQRDKSERTGQGGDRQPSAARDDDQRSEDQRPTGAALEKWDLVGANDVNDQGLREE